MRLTFTVFFTFIFLFLFSLYSSCFATSKGIALKLKNGSNSPKSIQLYKGGSYALIIGESKYYKGWPKLEAVPGELDKVESILGNKGFNITRKDNLNGDELEDAFSDFIDQYGYSEENRLIFYYSGHGHTRKNNEKGYLVPIDAPNPEKNEKLFLRKALPMSQVLSWARRIEAKHVMFLFDSCFSGTIFKTKDLPKTPPAISYASINPVRQFITAGSAGETVPAQSVFTPAFVDALAYGWGDLNKDGFISGTELGLYLQGKVPRYSNQFPQYGKINDYSLSRGDFIFLAGGNPGGVVSDAPVVYQEPTTGSLKVTSEKIIKLSLNDQGISGNAKHVQVKIPAFKTKQGQVETLGKILAADLVSILGNHKSVNKIEVVSGDYVTSSTNFEIIGNYFIDNSLFRLEIRLLNKQTNELELGKSYAGKQHQSIKMLERFCDSFIENL